MPPPVSLRKPVASTATHARSGAYTRRVVRLPINSPFGDSPVWFVPETDSTMDDARALVAAGSPSGVVVVAGYQRRGRGRRDGRVWIAPPGSSLLFTLALHRDDAPRPESYPIRTAVAVASAVEALAGFRTLIKWPNDVLVPGPSERGSMGARKLCGILCDYRDPWLCIGVGINLEQESFPAEVASTATSVRAQGASVPDRDRLLHRTLLELRHNEATWHAAAAERLWARGEEVLVRSPAAGGMEAGERQIVIEGIAPDGRLLARDSPTADVLYLAAGDLAGFGLGILGP